MIATATSEQVRFTVDEYFRMSEAGIFDDSRVELIDGRVYRMNAQANAHRWAVSKTMWALRSRFTAVDQFWVVVQGTVLLGQFGAPEPDLYVLNVPEGTPDDQLPVPFVIIEVSDSTYAHDAGLKLGTYAAAGVLDYWIINLQQRRVEVYRDPRPPTVHGGDWTYDTRTFHGPGDSVSLLAYPDVAVAVNEMLP
jgi:Uma2 family endonuclease